METETDLAQKLLNDWVKAWGGKPKRWDKFIGEEKLIMESTIESFALFCAQKILEKEKFLKEIIQQRNELRECEKCGNEFDYHEFQREAGKK